MRRKINTVCVMAFCVVASAQIPNNGFEVWTGMGNYSDPSQWGTLNAMTNFDGVYTCMKAAPGNPGASYLMLRSKSVTGLGIVPGMAATGVIDTAAYSIQGGFPFTQRPQALTGNWQFMSSNGKDFGFIAVYLTKWNPSMMVQDTVSKIVTSLIGMAMSWSPFSIPLTYKTGSFPDTAQIILSASGSTPYDGDYLYIDNLAFTGSVEGIEDHGPAANVSLFPNPSSGKVTMITHSAEFVFTQIQIINILGKEVLNIKPDSGNNSQMKLDLSSYKAGTYFIKVMTKSGLIVKKIIVQK